MPVRESRVLRCFGMQTVPPWCAQCQDSGKVLDVWRVSRMLSYQPRARPAQRREGAEVAVRSQLLSSRSIVGARSTARTSFRLYTQLSMHLDEHSATGLPT